MEKYTKNFDEMRKVDVVNEEDFKRIQGVFKDFT
jgi:hypothetical protein